MINRQFTHSFRDFRGGRMANQNLASMPETHGLVARNVFFLGDGTVRRRNGYTPVAAAGATVGGAVRRGFDYQRQSDQQQFVAVSGNGQMGWMRTDGSGYQPFSQGDDPNGLWSFVGDYHTLYAHNGTKALKIIDVQGSPKAYAHGLQPPAAIPSTAVEGGTLSLTYGRQYVYCYVSRWRDSAGTSRFHIGPPSPFSSYSGPVSNGAVLVGNLQPSVDPQVTHLWIFATVDTPQGTGSFYAFAAEIGNGVTAWADTLADEQLDLTRSAPWNNYPAPSATVLIEYNNRLVALTGETVQVSGFEEITLGVTQEAWPPALVFPVPGGLKSLSGAQVQNQALFLGTPDYWFEVQYTSAQNIQKQDKVMQPGPVGPKASCTMPGYLVWMGKDKKLRAWDCVSSSALELTTKIATSEAANILTLEDMDDSQLANVEVLHFHFGKFDWIVVLCSTQPDTTFDWIQIWDGSALARSSYQDQISTGTAEQLALADMFAPDPMTTAWVQEVNGTQYLYLGDATGAIYRFPDGFADNGRIIPASFTSVFSECGLPRVTKKFLSLDISTNREDAAQAFGLLAAAGESLDPNRRSVSLDVQPRRTSYGIDPTGARARLNLPGCSIGKWATFTVVFPMDTLDATVEAIEVAGRALFEVDA